MKNLILLLSIFFLFDSCNNGETSDYKFNAKVLTKGLDCNNSFLIKFNDDVNGLPVNNFNNTFYEINLPNEYKIDNMEIYVNFREPSDAEIMSCSSQGLAYPQIYIISVR